VVSTSHLGTASILQPGCGARVAPDRPDAFARAVLDVLDDPARAARLSSQARSYAQGWSSALMARRLANFYGELLDRDTAADVLAASG
jgi:glycosyltransferase involved in cell wall biosynthesis